MISLELVIKIFLLVPAVIFFFYSAVYLILLELNAQPNLSKFFRNISLILAAGGAILTALYMII